MTTFAITYDVRQTHPQYQSLYDQLNRWGAKHLQNSVWVAQLKGPAAAVRDILKAHVHADDTLCIMALDAKDWATLNARPEAIAMLQQYA